LHAEGNKKLLIFALFQHLAALALVHYTYHVAHDSAPVQKSQLSPAESLFPDKGTASRKAVRARQRDK
jgi:hypothetical protein